MEEIAVYFNKVSKTIEIDRGSSITTIKLDATLDNNEVASVIQSSTMRQIIEQIIKGDV